MYEQDFLNILTFYCNYKVKFLDGMPKNLGQYVLEIVLYEEKKFWGLSAKGYWSEVILKDKKLILPKNSGSEIDPWPIDNDHEIVAIHFAEGAKGGKFDHIDTQFEKDVAHYLKYLISNGQKT